MHSYYFQPNIQVVPYEITFTEVEATWVKLPHNDALVTTIMVANYQVHRILVDNKSSVDILYMKIFGRMNIDKDKLRPIKTLLMSFEGESVIAEGAIQLPVTIEKTLDQVTSMVNFLVVAFLFII